MRRYAARRALQVLPAVLGTVGAAFVLVHLAPGEPVFALAGEFGDAEYYAEMRERFGLDQPIPERLITYFARVIQGDFGTSYVQGRAAIDVVVERLPATLLLTGTAFLVSAFVGIVLGIVSALRRGRALDTAINAMVLGLFAAPVFWLGQVAILGLAYGTGWFPVQGMTVPGSEAAGLARFGEIAHHLALPVLVLASQQLAAIARLTRAGLITELVSDHVRTARGKGLRESTVVVRHALRGALLPVVTVLGTRLGFLLAGAVVVEVVFGWPGLGQLMITSLSSRDLPVLMALFFLVAFTVIVANLLTDLLYAWLDPRIRYG